MSETPSIFIGKGENPVHLPLRYANRHGLIAGATGTGKTVSLQILAEGFSAAGVPVFMADVKGDLSGICAPGDPGGKVWPKLIERAETIGLGALEPEAFPTVFWDLFGKDGHPVRATISEMGPLLLSRLLGLNETQEGVMYAAFAVADDEGWMLLDLPDLVAILNFVSDHRDELRTEYGSISPASVGAIRRRLLALEREGGELFFGEPALKLDDLMRTDRDGRGYVSILAAQELIQKPSLYATFLLWLLSELFEELPEVGDPDKPKLVLFFDEAHLLFEDAPKVVLERVEQVVRLIRSKGVGVYFISQSPSDIPEDVLGQLGNRVQHALRAFTPRDRKTVRAAAETFRPNPAFKAEDVITELGVGEALVSVLESRGTPSIVERTLIRPPASNLGPAPKAVLQASRSDSPVGDHYDETIDRESAFEILTARAEEEARREEEAEKRQEEEKRRERESRQTRRSRSRSSRRQGVGETLAKSVARTIGSQVGRSIVRGLLGSIMRGF